MTIFSNSDFEQIRVLEIKGEPWFVGKDVANILRYTNSSKALTDHVDEEDKLYNESLLSLGQRGGWLINESDLYSLIFASKKTQLKIYYHKEKLNFIISSFVDCKVYKNTITIVFL